MKKLPWRSAMYLIVFSYLLLDLRFCNGPVKRKIAETRPSSGITREKAARLGWVAIVNQEPVTTSHLQLAVSRYVHQRGMDLEELNASGQKRIKRAALNKLIDDVLIRQYADGAKYSAPQKEIDAFIKSWENQFASETELRNRSGWQELSKQERDQELGRIWSRKRWIEKEIEPGLRVTEEEARVWYEQNPMREPEKIRARQIFISTVEGDSEAREELIKQAYQRISVDGQDFGELAKKLSQDDRTKNHGGDLNWFSRSRLDPEFAKVVFEQQVGELGKPFRTAIGWHLVEVTDHQPARESIFEEMREEVIAYLENGLRRQTIALLLKKRRKVASIVVFAENL